jgi:ubiquinone/menaquinone biosynthesis C-methylase UbiE
MPLKQFFASQLRAPHGWFGSHITANLLNRHNKKIIDSTLALLKVAPQHHVLEIGFGGGYSLQQLTHGYRASAVTAIDISPEMVHKAQSNFSREIKQGRLRVQIGDVSRMPFAASVFDRAFTINTIYFWPDPAKALAEIRRVLKEGALLAISIRSREKMQKREFTKYNFQLYAPQDVHRIVEHAGFRNVHIDHQDAHKAVDQAIILGTR